MSWGRSNMKEGRRDTVIKGEGKRGLKGGKE